MKTKHTNSEQELELRKEVELLIGEEFLEPLAKVNYGYTQSKLAMDKLMQLIQSEREKVLASVNPIDLVEPCNPDCTPEEHAYHQGTWDAHLKLEKILAKLAQKEKSK